MSGVWKAENYDAVKAKAEFIDSANHILNACQMAPIDEKQIRIGWNIVWLFSER